MTQKTKCKLLFFSIWPGVQCGTRFIEDPVCNYALRRHLQLFSYILFAHRERHGDTSPSSEKFVLSIGWLTISDEGVVKKLDTLRRKNLLQLFRDFLILHIFNILRQIFTTLYFAVVHTFNWESVKVSSINDRLSINMCIQCTIDQLQNINYSRHFDP